MDKEKEKGFFSNEGTITTILLVLVTAILLFSQSFAVNANLSVGDMFLQVLNYNYIYFLLLVYFILLKTNFGKKYFNYLNIGLIVIYIIKLVSSFFTLFQVLTLSTLLNLIISAVIVIFLIHTLLKDTRVWSDYSLSSSPFNDIEGEWYYDFIIVASSILLAVDLISSTSLNGVFLSVLDYIYIIFFTRYIYLYNEYLNKKYLKDKMKERFDKAKEKIKDVVEENILEIKDEIIEEKKELLDKKVDDIEDIEEEKVNEKEETIDDKDKVVKDKKNKNKKSDKKKGSDV